jgi:phosphoserine phosphatase
VTPAPRFFALFLAFFFCAALPAAAKRPLNPRYKKKRAAASAESAGPASALATRLLPARWDPQVRSAIELVAETQGSKSPQYDPDNPPVAVLPFDDSFIDGDIAELAFWRLVRRVEFKFDDDFWRVVPVAYGRQKLRAAYEAFSAVPAKIWDSQPEYHQYCKGFLESYRGVCDKVGRKECREYLARLWRGYSRDEAMAYMAAVWDDELQRAPSVEDVPGEPGDAAPARARRGLLVAPEMRDLVRFLRETGFEVWLESPDQSTLLRAAASKVGADPKKTAGIVLTSFKDRLGSSTVDPIPMRTGKVEALTTGTGRVPAIVVGSGPDDVDLMAYGNGLRVLLDAGEPHLRALAEKAHWKIQPAFVRR